MTTSRSVSIQQSIAANKFYPPRINRTQSLDRHNVLTDRLSSAEFSGQIIIVEAQAGQGKTTLVHQYLEHIDLPFIWYQIGSEDNDPVVLLAALSLAFCRKFDSFASPQLDAVLENGQIGPMDLQRCANILLNDIDAALDKDLFLVLDDLHLISDGQLTNQLLDYIIDTSPPHLHYILISRHPLTLKARAIRKKTCVTYLDSEDLALGVQEIEYLCNSVLGTCIGRNQAEHLHEVTNGWIMGVVMAAKPLLSAKTTTRSHDVAPRGPDLFASGEDSYILNFFQDEILTQVPADLHNAFITLSFIDEISIDFARELVGIDDLASHLETMADRNFFVYRLDEHSRMFRFHHLFQEFLQSRGRLLLSQEEIRDIYRRTADYYLQHNLLEKTLKALLNGEDYETMEQVLKTEGLKLISTNRTVTILAILQTIHEEILLEYGWLSFYKALLTTDFHPQTTLPYFHACSEKFIENGEEVGELMSLSQIIYFHFVISGRYSEGSKLLNRTRTLYESLQNELPREISIIVVRNLAAGYCFFDGKMDLARHYARKACDLAERLGSKNFIAASRFILGYIGLLSGDTRRARMEIEKSYRLISDPLVGMSNRLTLHIMQLCELSMSGSFRPFLYHKNLVLKGVDQEIVRQTVAAPYLYIWSAIGLIGNARLDDALDVLEQGMVASKTAASEHMTSQLLQWRAIIHALKSNEQRALDDIELATEMRDRAGGPFFLGFHTAIKGAVLSNLGDTGKARDNLNRALEIGEQIPSPYLQVYARACLADIEFRSGNDNRAEHLLRSMLEQMIEAGYAYFWGWESKMMKRLLSEAVKRNIEPDFARELAGERLGLSIETNGETIPILMIRVLGTFSISVGDVELFNLRNLSNHQRELFGLLISSPELRISQDQVQLALWPDSPPDKAGKTFYTLISRLRKVLAEKIDDPTRYICVEKGFVQLKHCCVDSSTFLALSRKGLSLTRRELEWQAGNAFQSALSCWQEFSEIDIFQGEQVLDYVDDVRHVLRRVCLTWAHALSARSRVDEALALLEKTDRVLSSDEDRIALQHRLYLEKKNPLKAQALLDGYAQELVRLGYDDDEVEEMKGSVRSPSA